MMSVDPGHIMHDITRVIHLKIHLQAHVFRAEGTKGRLADMIAREALLCGAAKGNRLKAFVSKRCV